ncbi:MAG TPA: SGNH/GDSL hydrolase family protein [Xanthobacteraceae bacterium]|nr:SGNH/GDSL hydrolase family protein [Xanthobacteraceae bacterium]
MKTILIAFGLVLVAACVAKAQPNTACAVAQHLATADFRLPHVAAAIAAKRLNISVIGSASSSPSLAATSGANKGYPARLESLLGQKLPGVVVTVTTHAKARETAANMETQFIRVLAADKPALVIWQTGTVEALRRSDVDDFRSVLEDGIGVLHHGNSDVILMNMQYSPRTELVTDPTQYADAMRIVAMQQEIPLFDRLAIMRHWGELGTFDFNEVTKTIDTAAQVHDCIARLLAHQIVEGANLPNSVGNAIR